MNNSWISFFARVKTRMCENLVDWKRPITTGFLGFLFLRLWSSFVLLYLRVYPPDLVPSDVATRIEQARLENSGWFSQLFLAPWYRWDTVHYLSIASQGYFKEFLSVWPPLYPGLIRLLSATGMSSLLSAIIISNICALLVMILLSRISEEIYPGSGENVVLCLVIYPLAFFLVAPYTESIFLIFSLASLWLARRGRFARAGIWALLATLTRLQGVILVIPILYEGYRQVYCNLPATNRRGRIWALSKICCFASLPFLAVFGHAFFVHFSLKYAWPWESLAKYWGQHTGFPWEGLIGNITTVLGLRKITTPIVPLAQVIDLLMIVFALISLIMMWIKKKTIPLSYQLYAWAGLAVILMKVDDLGILVSASRYVLSLFPVFMFNGFLLGKIPGRFTRSGLIVIGLALQGILLIFFARWIWIA